MALNPAEAVNVFLPKADGGEEKASARWRQRYRRISLTAAASSVSRMVSFATGVIAVRLLVGYLGTERYALWATISSTMAFLGFADLGVSNGLLNAISQSDGAEDRETAATYASTGFFLLLLMASSMGCIFGLSYSYIPWARVFNLSSPLAIREAGPTVAVLVGCFLIYLPVTMAQRVQLGYQMGFINQGWEAAGNLLSLAALICAIHWRAGLVLVVLALTGGPVFSGVLNAATLFTFQCPWVKPKLALFSSVAARRLLTLGFLFVVIQLATATAYQTDNLILAQVLGAAAVTGYAIPLKLFGFAPAVLSLLVAPLWPAYGEAMTRGDLPWVRHTLRYSMASVVAVSATASLALIFAAPSIIHYWVGPAIQPSTLLLVGMGLWATLGSITATLAMFLNGIGFVRVQAICSVLMAAVNLLLSIVLTHHIGVAGVIYGTVISHAIFILVPYCYFVPGLLADLNCAPDCV